jgi:hypothetical protein
MQTSARDITDLIEDKTGSYAMPNSALPAYREEFIDPVFGTKLMRITNASADGAMVPMYSKTPPWNRDGTRLLIYRQGGDHILLDGNSYAQIKVMDWDYNGCGYPPADVENVWWSHTDPDILTYPTTTTVGETPCFVKYHVSTGAVDVLRQFGEFGGNDPYVFGAMGEGKPSWNDSVVVFEGRRGSKSVYFAYDIVNNIVHRYDTLIAGKNQDPGEYGPDWACISPSGRDIVILADNDIGVYDIDMNLLRKFAFPGGHADMTIDNDGNDAIVIVDQDSKDAPRLVKLRISDGTVTNLVPNPDWEFQGTHISTCNSRLPGWVYISTCATPNIGGSVSDRFYKQIYRIKLDGSRIERIAHHHSDPAYEISNSDYWAEPHIAVNFDGTKMIFGSNWVTSTGAGWGVNNTYVVDLSPGGSVKNDKKPLAPVPHNALKIVSITGDSHYVTYRLPAAGDVRLNIYNSAGVLIQSIINPNQKTGLNTIKIKESTMGFGAYYYSLATGSGKTAQKVIRIK